jgi:hypothetical protein
MVAEHSAWLTWAIGLGFGRRRRDGWDCLPRIPVRRVADGGFARLMSTPGGRYRAERWWDKALGEQGDLAEE